MQRIAKLASLALACPLFTWAQTTTAAGTPAQTIVTVGHHYGHAAPALTKDDLIVTQHYQLLPVTNVIPFRGPRAGLELYILVDHCSNCEPGSKFEELSHFITSQPLTTAVGVAYIQSGRLLLAQNPTVDHERAVKSLNTPEGSKPSSPFTALADLIRTWPRGPSHESGRRVVLMVSNGINPSATDQLQDPSAEAALAEAQRAGVIVYSIYHPSADYLATDSSQLYTGQVQLAHVADESGGEAYFLGFGPLPSFAPFLADLSDHLANQYLVEFVANTAEVGGSLEQITVKSKAIDAGLMTPDKVSVRGRAPVSGAVSPHPAEAPGP
jgi:hypothetical protein